MLEEIISPRLIMFNGDTLTKMSKSNIKVIGITGHLTSGKDTFFSLLDYLYPEKFRRLAFADGLKGELDALVKKEFGFSLFACVASQKAVIRPLLIGWGMARRNQEKDYWINSLLKKMDDLCSLDKECFPEYEPITVVTDVRYENEVLALRKKYGDGFKLVKVSRPDAKVEIPQEEQINQPLVDKYADYTVIWETVGEEKDLNQLDHYVVECYNHLFIK